MITGRKTEFSDFIREKAFETGFDLCGIARAKKLTSQEAVFTGWLKSGMNAKMAFLGREPGKRYDPSLLFADGVSVVVAGLRYSGQAKQGGKGVPVISRYAYGTDYHTVISEKLNIILTALKEKEPSVSGMVCVDSSPVSEKSWAVEAGFGWQGRNSLVINEKAGSFFFLGILMLNIELDYNEHQVTDRCGSCRLCTDACPTEAINDNRTIDARKCISYHTIENKETIPSDLSGKFRGRVFGCDICQEVCPWNRNAGADIVPEFRISEGLERMTAKDWVSLTPERFKAIFAKSPAGRIKYERMMRNVAVAISSRPDNQKPST